MSDPRLDRLVEFDPRSRNFPIRATLSDEQLERPVRSYTWSVPVALDQGREGACVGFAWSHELAARPYSVKAVTNDTARAVYHEAQKNDEWPGEDYSGTSVLAGAKVIASQGYMSEYRWAGVGSGDVLGDLKRAVAYKGPAVLGIHWYTGMFRPDSDGRIRPTGQVEGGHAIINYRTTGERYRVRAFRHRNYLWNSWGRDGGWPVGWLSDDDMERLLNESGEACIPVVRRK